MFDFGVLKPFVDNANITDIDCNGMNVFVTHAQKGKYKVLDLQEGYLEDILNRLCNYPQIDSEFNYHRPILDGTMDNLRIHAVHSSIMYPNCWLSIRKNPVELKVKEKDYKKIFELLHVANQCKWSYVFGGERGSGKTQWMRSSIALLDKRLSVAIIAENDEMHMVECLRDRLISQYIVNDILDYEKAAASILRDNSDYVVFQEVRDHAIDNLFLILSSCSRVMTTLHVKSALLMPQRMIQLSRQKNDEHLQSIIHDYVQMCIVPVAEESGGKIKRYISEIALFWNEQGVAKKQLIYEQKQDKEYFYPFPAYFQADLKRNQLTLEWSE